MIKLLKNIWLLLYCFQYENFVIYIWTNIGSSRCAKFTHNNGYKKNVSAASFVWEDSENWSQEIEIWQCVAEPKKKKQGPEIYLPSERKARKACEGIDVKALNTDDGVYVLTNKLKELYGRDTEQTRFIAYNKFERYQWKQTVSISDYTNEYKRLNDRIKKYGMEMPNDVLPYQLLINANTSEKSRD